jgi:hypothetical protein
MHPHKCSIELEEFKRHVSFKTENKSNGMKVIVQPKHFIIW